MQTHNPTQNKRCVKQNRASFLRPTPQFVQHRLPSERLSGFPVVERDVVAVLDNVGDGQPDIDEFSDRLRAADDVLVAGLGILADAILFDPAASLVIDGDAVFARHARDQCTIHRKWWWCAMKVVADLPDDVALELAQRHDDGDLDAALADAAQLYNDLENPGELLGDETA